MVAKTVKEFRFFKKKKKYMVGWSVIQGFMAQNRIVDRLRQEEIYEVLEIVLYINTKKLGDNHFNI